MKRFGLSTLILAVFLSVGNAQEKDTGYNEHSIHPVHESYIMYKKILWRRIDLREKQNRPFFSRNGEISTIIINAVKQGVLFPYENDSLTTRMTKENFLDNMKIPNEGGDELTQEEIDMGFGQEEDDGFGDEFDDDEEESASDEFLPQDYSIMEIKEDMIFDRNRSRMYYDIHAVTLVLPADKNPALFEKPLASFRYKDLEKLFRSMPKEAVWYNVQNIAEHRNFADALALRLFSSNLIKYANPEDNRIVDIYDKSRRDGILASQRLEHDLIEFEVELWEY